MVFPCKLGGVSFSGGAVGRGLTRDICTALGAVLLAFMPALGGQYTKQFDASPEKVWDACVRVAEEDYTSVGVARRTGMVSFLTKPSITADALDVTVKVERQPNGKTSVVLHATKRRQLNTPRTGGAVSRWFFKRVARLIRQ